MPVPVSPETLDKLLQIADAVLQEGARLTDSAGSDGGYGEKRVSLFEFQLGDPEKLIQAAMDDAVARARKLAEQAARHMDKPAPKLVRVQVSDSRIAGDRRDSYVSDSRGAIGALPSWQPVRASVTLDASFSYE